MLIHRERTDNVSVPCPSACAPTPGFLAYDGGAFLGARIVEFVVEAKAELPGVGEVSMEVYNAVPFGFST
jgi:hypothetical protein